VLLWVNHISTLGIEFSFKRSFIALPFALAAVSAIFSPLGNPLGDWSIGPLVLIPTDYGLIKFGSILLRSWLSVQGAIILVATTRFPDMIHAFEHLHVPAVLTTIVAFLYRYLFVLTDEVMRLLRARQARSATVAGKKSGRTVVWRARVAGNMAGQLFLRSYERSDRIYNAMLARGYTGQLRTLHPHAMQPSDWLFAALSIIVILLLQLTGRF
jgi:cobalt/nickel transport system permease protein